MQARIISYQDLNIPAKTFTQKALTWANRFPVVAFYQNNGISYPYGGFDNLLAVTTQTKILVDPAEAFKNLQNVVEENNSLLCGILSYDLKNQIEKLTSTHPDWVGFPLIYFFRPEIYIYFQATTFEITCPAKLIEHIISEILITELPEPKPQVISVKQRVSRKKYLETVKTIQQHILEGDVYEINYCHEFYGNAATLEPVSSFLKLNEASPMPFAGFFKLIEKYLLCASPERSLKKEGSTLISQPIKGTIKRSANPEQDQLLRQLLQNSEKEISENMMIMDLVRNDLSKSSEIGSVQVEEMFGIYGFQHLYQMITTVTSRIKPTCTVAEALKNAFPMGSMTGAPKIRAMELIEQYEASRRGLFSGSFGYFKPNGNFDFNVVIRSLQYNAATGYLSFMVGSAITYDSDPEQEYAECLLKAEAIRQILNK